ncbi:MAG: histidine phosphatase family protein [Actinomycetota bacterium]|nr:histidine phosphatase family protein [Actinomycetota bacterium]
MSETCYVYLTRHGEVANPNHVVYGDLPGFHLSPTGVLQAHRCAEHLSNKEIDAVITSPLDRAVQTATAVARRHGITPQIDLRLTEARQFPHWTGHRWDTVAELFRFEFASYLHDASRAGGHETLDAVALRMGEAIKEQLANGRRRIVVVGHQDPTQAIRLTLTGGSLADLRREPPAHAEVITLSSRDQQRWSETSRWAPPSLTAERS